MYTSGKTERYSLAYDDKERYLKEFQSTFDVDSKTVEKYFIKSKKKYNLTNKVFLESSLHKLSTYLSLETVRSMMQLWRLDINKSLHSLNQKVLKINMLFKCLTDMQLIMDQILIKHLVL